MTTRTSVGATYREPKALPLNLRPTHGEAFRWLPRHGRPCSLGEWCSQRAVRVVAFLPLYTALVTTLTLIVVWRTG